MAIKKPKWYVVWTGHSPGLYSSWEKCKDQVDGFPGAKYKAYDTLTQAKAAMESGIPASLMRKTAAERLAEKKPRRGRGPVVPSVSVDAACNMTTGEMEYRGVDTATGTELFRMGPFSDSTNNIGEFLAVVHGLGMLARQESTIPVYTDSRTAMAWVKQRTAKTTIKRTRKNTDVFALMERAQEWLRANDYPNRVSKWETDKWGENPADFGRK